MGQFFKPVVDEIIRLIEEQVETGKKAGGRKLSVRPPYVRHELTQLGRGTMEHEVLMLGRLWRWRNSVLFLLADSAIPST
jgi:hypothetical protein